MFGQPKSLPVDAIERQLDRLNQNIERLLNHLNVRPAPPPEALATAEKRTFVGEALDEMEQAVKEHAELLGMEPERGEEG